MNTGEIAALDALDLLVVVDNESDTQLQSFAETALCTVGGYERGNTFGASVGTDSSREYSFQNRHAPLYLTCITPCEAQKQRGLLLVLADI